MPVRPRERLVRVLGGSPAPGAFSTQLSVPARNVELTVAGAGPISFPVKAPQAKRMIASARPARFGRGEQTLMDLSVRDTWEIAPDQVTLTGLDWDAILAEVLETPAIIPGPGLRGDQSEDLEQEDGEKANVRAFGPNSAKKYVAPDSRTR
jgi:hypothetical protein